jgi:6,7-dimethyl-8-ribityllumazine synthase
MVHHKGPAAQIHDGSSLRIGIVHARWNDTIIDPLLAGAKAKLRECGVKESNIVVQTVPGSWELPIAVQRYVKAPLTPNQTSSLHLLTLPSLYAASQVQSSSSGSGASAGDLLGSTSADELAAALPSPSSAASTGPFDAIIAIGVLIKGETMHFEYIAGAVSEGLMRVSLDTGVPVIFGVLTVLTEDQAKARAGIIPGSHNHGEDWGLAAVEMGVKRKAWANGTIE